MAVVTEERRALAAQAQALRAQGMLHREIAAELGLSRSYAAALTSEDPLGEKAAARKESYRGVCSACGGPTTGSMGPTNTPKRCATCAAADPPRIWTQESVIAEIQRWALNHGGRPPVASEWLTAELHRGYPACSVVSGKGRPFASWADAIEAAGFPRPHVGHKVNARGRGVSHMARTYHVLHRNGDGGLHEQTVEAYSPENAIEKVADKEGSYVAILDSYWFEFPVEPRNVFAVVKPAA